MWRAFVQDRCQLDMKRRNNLFVDTILEIKYLRHVAVIPFGPKVIAIRRIDQLGLN